MLFELRDTYYGLPLMMILSIITSVPPLFGLTAVTTTTGYIYGIRRSCVWITMGAFLGSLLCYGLVRRYNLHKYIVLSDAKREIYESLEEAVGQNGLKMVILIRLCPIPWQLTNLILSMFPSVSWHNYLLASFLASFKVNMGLWIGQQLSTLSDPSDNNLIPRLSMLLGILLLGSVSYWIYHSTLHNIKRRKYSKQLDVSHK
ncbi:hypothetical protein BDB01DRAFT_849967 [Pilobolus umbonatus]|nr:hypothetical protein BDB01DRAFT_849967 [Pilobolus umbonatus]